jgi:adenylosuccinate synthase
MTPDNSRASNTAVVGLQWGDEGKGKISDLLMAEHDVIVRYNGGANAGHTVVLGDESYALHLVPSGILHQGKTSVIGNGVVVDPAKLLQEIDGLQERGIEIDSNLLISDRAHVVMPYHKEHDAALEQYLAKAAGSTDRSIGTTRRGIGPAYADKVHRSTAIRMGDLLNPATLQEQLRITCSIRTAELRALGVDAPPLDPDALAQEYAALGDQLRSQIIDTTWFLHDAIAAGRRLLFEGANACLLDIDHGTYPYVTSSNCSTLGIPSGTGLPGRYIDRVVGIMKAYSTRVGGGPFPTELNNEVGQLIRDQGHEYGTTTGRPRRCGWLDLVAVKYSSMICDASEIAVMLLDVLTGVEDLSICTAYRLPDGTVTDRFIPDARRMEGVEPILQTLSGWTQPITTADNRCDLPDAANAYLDFVEAYLDIPVSIVSVGPERTQTLVAAS